MWQVSLPTAVAPILAPSQVPTSLMKPVPAANGRNSAKQAKSVPARPAAAKQPTYQPSRHLQSLLLRPSPQSEAATQLPSLDPSPNPHLPSPQVNRTACRICAKTQVAGQPINTEIHAPGDFLASLQGNSSRVQQSKPTSPPSESPNRKFARLAPASPAIPTILRAPVPVRSTGAETAPAARSLASAPPPRYAGSSRQTKFRSQSPYQPRHSAA